MFVFTISLVCLNQTFNPNRSSGLKVSQMDVVYKRIGYCCVISQTSFRSVS